MLCLHLPAVALREAFPNCATSVLTHGSTGPEMRWTAEIRQGEDWEALGMVPVLAVMLEVTNITSVAPYAHKG